MYDTDANLVIYTDANLKFKLDADLDMAETDRNPSLYINTGKFEIRQFCKTEQLIALRDMLLEAFPINELVKAE